METAHQKLGRRIVATVAAVGLRGVVLAAAPHVVPELAEPLELEFEGRTTIDRGDSAGHVALSEPSGIMWRHSNGAWVSKGDPIMIFSAGRIAAQVPQRRAELEGAEIEYQAALLELEEELDALTTKKSDLKAELRVVRAQLDTARRTDESRITLLEEEYRQAEQNAQAKATICEGQRELHELGQVSQVELAAAKLAADLAEAAIIPPKLAWEQARGLLDHANIAALEVKEQQILTELGAIHQDDPEAQKELHGLNRQIDAVRKKAERTREKLLTQRDAAARRLQVAERDSRDHTPLCWIEVLDEKDRPVRRINFQPDTVGCPPGYEADTGRAYEEERGFGWDKDVRDMLYARAAETSPTSTVAVIHGQATWKCAVPNGDYTVRLCAGDDRDWTGSFARMGETATFVRYRIAKDEYPREQWKVPVTDGMLRVHVGGPKSRMLRASTDGMLHYPAHRWYTQPGNMVFWTDWPLMYVMDPSKIKVKVLVLQDAIDLLKVFGGEEAQAPGRPEEPRANDNGITDFKSRMAVDRVLLRTASGATAKGRISTIGTKPVRLSFGTTSWSEWEMGEKGNDLIATEVIVVPEGGTNTELRLDETVVCRVRIDLPAGLHSLPGHLVASHRNESFVQFEGDEDLHLVHGFRVGERFLVTEGIAPGVSLVTPVLPSGETRTDQASYVGHVVPGERTEIRLATTRGWGRVEDLVPEGSYVEEGDTVLSLYLPLEDEREDMELLKQKAQQEYLLAAEERRVEGVKARLANEEKLRNEKLARSTLKTAGKIDAVALATAEKLHIVAQATADHAAEKARMVQAIAKTSPSLAGQSRFAARLAELSATKTSLAFVKAQRVLDWLAREEARRRWKDTVAALSFREEEMELARKKESVARMRAEVTLMYALEMQELNRGPRRDLTWLKEFERFKNVKTPVSGRIFFLRGWNDQKRKHERIQKDFPVWEGMPLAEVLDMSKMSFEVEVPEDLYPGMKIGRPMTVEFEQFNHLHVSATVSDVGKLFTLPKARAAADREAAVSARRVFKIKLDMETTAEHADRLVPGTNGKLVL